MVFNFSDPVPKHKCEIIEPIKVSNTRTNLVCVVCKQVIGCWDDLTETKTYPENASFYTEATLDELK
jgi:hypothetical protein